VTIPFVLKTEVARNGFLLTLPALVFSVSLMAILPNAITPAQFNEGVPKALIAAERVARVFVFGMPLFFSIGFSSITQRVGLAAYLLGLALYCSTYWVQNFLPQSAWSSSVYGFAASAYTNAFWMIGLGLLGEKFYFPKRFKYRPVFYILPATLFVILHTTHAVLYKQTHS
jgi:hypothetical protein